MANNEEILREEGNAKQFATKNASIPVDQFDWDAFESEKGLYDDTKENILGKYDEIFSSLTSTQVTMVPVSAKQVPLTKPTYPVPTTAIFI